MKIRKIICICIILCLSCFGCTTTEKEYVSEDKGVSLILSNKYEIEETDGYIRVWDNKNKTEVIINMADVSDEVDETYTEMLETAQLDIQCGAFDATYNNYVYVSNLFTYLLEGNGYGLAPTWMDKTTFGTDDYFAYYSALEGENNCGYIYETLQNGKLYIICIYIDDYYDAIFDYSEEVDSILCGITFSEK